jgi:signal transduction histidine kinase/MFS family permease
MKNIIRSRNRIIRRSIVSLAVVAYFLLMLIDAVRYFPNHLTSSALSLSLLWARYGFSALVAFMFLSVGALVWLYGRNRSIAISLFCFSFTMMVTFAMETAASFNDALSLAISGAASSLTLIFFLILLLRFPKDFLATKIKVKDLAKSNWHKRLTLLLPVYVGILLLLCLVSVLVSFPDHLTTLRTPTWINNLLNAFFLLVLISILITIIVSYFQTPSLRERQQHRIFVGSVILAIFPFLTLTILPRFLYLPARFVIDPQLSTITIALFPLAFGYTILRYQVLVFDHYIRRTVMWTTGVVSLVVISYFVIMVSILLVPTNALLQVVFSVLLMAFVGPLTWWAAHFLVERLFFSEMLHYRRLVEDNTNTDLMASESFDIDEAAQLLTAAALNVFETREICVYVLDGETKTFRLYPPLDANSPQDSRNLLVKRLLEAKRTSSKISTDSFDPGDLIVTRVDTSKRPLLLNEASKTLAELPGGIARFITLDAPEDHTDPVLAPIRAQGKMIGMLVMGERFDHQQYAGPDFEGIVYLLSRFSPILESARLYDQAHRRAEELRIAYEGLKEVDRLKDQFITTASHELRTPLTAVQGYIELLSEHEASLSTEMRAGFIAKARRGCDELTLMVNNIMDASRLQVEIEHVQLVPVSLIGTVSHVLEILEALTRRERRKIHMDIPTDLFVLADTVRLRQVMLNLLSNALKYSPAGTGIEITTTLEGESATVFIRDHGMGIPLEHQERLFGRFMRLERDMNSPVRGAGLGLFISKRLITAMGGRIWVESSGIPGEGSTFAFTLDLAEVHKQEPVLSLGRQEV